MTMRRVRITILLLLAVRTFASGQADEPIPFASFSEISVNIKLPQYRNLLSDGGAVEIDGGVRGIIVYREDENTFIAYERNCTYEPSKSCAVVEIDMSRLFFVDKCCGSMFNLRDGNPSKGPARWALRQYKVRVSGSTLTITDDIVN